MAAKIRSPESLPYRPCVGLTLFNRQGLVFVAQRIDTKGDAWQMPQGGIDDGEAPRDAALRELEEEIGTAKAEIVGESAGWYDYDLPPDLIGKMWGGRFRGQRQKWFALRFTGRDDDIDLKTAHPEFRSWKWTPIATLTTLAIWFKRPIYESVAAEFARFARPD
ncbi:MAG: RNA pyrophosphohydrolase [Alphaproteobacteria bacterium]|nr:RNA pyrophosphohydrolase [Alphaproteobacteria bacterium]